MVVFTNSVDKLKVFISVKKCSFTHKENISKIQNYFPFSTLYRSAVLSLRSLADIDQLGPVLYSDYDQYMKSVIILIFMNKDTHFLI